MGGRRFDRKFGPDLVRGLAPVPAVYLFRDDRDRVIYVGKAKNVRRRLASYRNAGRRRAHRKMRMVVREAHTVEVRPQPSEADALQVENELIRTLRPRFNVDGAFHFLYPAIGVGAGDGQLRLCFTTRVEAHAGLGLSWHGCFRSRLRARDAFDALVALLDRIGHREPRSRLPAAPRFRGSLWLAFRRVPPALLGPLRSFLDGESDALLAELFALLLESARARREAAEVEAALRLLAAFHRRDARRLRRAREAARWDTAFVPQLERDALFLRARAAAASVRPGAAAR